MDEDHHQGEVAGQVVRSEEEFLALWHSEKAMYEAWGELVTSTIKDSLKSMLGTSVVKVFLRIPPAPRVKDDGKLLEKAFERGKGYDDPYAEITDKVGVRFVVLLAADLGIVCQAVTDEAAPWRHTLDRDFEKEQAENPFHFDYAALHFVVRAEGDQLWGDEIIRDGTPCEVQIKTLLQHAYAEITHDSIYKPKLVATPKMRRNAATSMALLEATDSYFTTLMNLMQEIIDARASFTAQMEGRYREVVGEDSESSQLEGTLVDSLMDLYSSVDAGLTIDKTLKENSHIGERVKSRRQAKRLYRQPSIIAAYALAANHRHQLRQAWTLGDDLLDEIFTDLGISSVDA